MKLYWGILLLAMGLNLPLANANAEELAFNQSSDEASDLSFDDSGYISDPREAATSYFEDGVQQLSFMNQSHRPGTGRSVFIFVPRQLRWYAYDASGNLVGSGRASGGREFCLDIRRRCRTPVGVFSVHSMGDASCISTKFPVGRGGAPMPYCMFFRGGFAVHGSYEIPNYNASHGCIRVEPSAARWLRYNVMHVGSTVIVRPY